VQSSSHIVISSPPTN